MKTENKIKKCLRTIKKDLKTDNSCFIIEISKEKKINIYNGKKSYFGEYISFNDIEYSKKIYLSDFKILGINLIMKSIMNNL